MWKKTFGRKVTTVHKFRREKRKKLKEYKNGRRNYNMNYLINLLSDMTVRHTYGDCSWASAMNVLLKLVFYDLTSADKSFSKILKKEIKSLNFKTVFYYSKPSVKR